MSGMSHRTKQKARKNPIQFRGHYFNKKKSLNKNPRYQATKQAALQNSRICKNKQKRKRNFKCYRFSSLGPISFFLHGIY